ncbi:MAG TPA: creatininase family protein [Rhizomicrobium sp.]
MNFADLAWPAIRDIVARGHAVAILPCGATEAHGPHLPLGTDVIISEGVARRAAETLERSGVAALVLPSIAYAPADCAAEFAGTITIGASAAKAILIDIARSLKMQGFSCLGLANSHFDPANVAMLRDVVADIRGMGLAVAFPDFTRRALAQRLTAEFLSGACHAGRFESSLVLADRPDLVNEAVRRALPENPSSLTAAFSRGARTFSEAGGADAYFGDPRHATAEEGERTFRVMADALVAAVREVIAG